MYLRLEPSKMSWEMKRFKKYFNYFQTQLKRLTKINLG